MTGKDWLLLFTLSFLWGCSYFLIEVGLEGFSVVPLVTVRLSIAAVILWLVVGALRAGIPSGLRIWGSFAVMGLLNNIVPFSLITWGQTTIASSLAAILTATTPMFAVVVALLWQRDETVGANKIVGLVIGFVGVVIMIGRDALADIGSDVIAQLAVVAAALSYALAGAYGRRFAAQGIPPTVSAAGQVTMSAVMLLLVLIFHGNWDWVSSAALRSWLAVVALAAFSTAMAYVLYFRILQSAGSVNLMLVTFLMPATAVILGVVVLDESLGAAQIAGMVLLAIALLAIDGRWLRRNTG